MRQTDSLSPPATGVGAHASGAVAGRGKTAPATEQNLGYKRILLVVDACQAGDTLRIVPYIAAVRDQYRRAHITLLVNQDARAALASVDIFNRVLISRLFYHRPYSRFGPLFSKARELLHLLVQLGTGYDLVIFYHCGSPLLHLLGYAVCRGKRIGFGYPGIPPWMLSSRLAPFNLYGSVTTQHASLLRAAGIHLDDKTAPSMRWGEADAATVSRILREYGLAGAARLVVLHPGSDWACQQWLQSRWAEVADELAARYSASILFTGSRSETDYIDSIQQRMKSASASLAGRTSLTQLAALLARSHLCVCVDSAIFELTQAIGIPAVVLAGPTRPDLVNPRSHLPLVVNCAPAQLVTAIRSCKDVQARRNFQAPGRAPTSIGCLDYRCHMAGLREITVEDVLRAVERQARIAELAVNAQETGRIEP